MAFRVETSARAKRDLDLILMWLQKQHAGDAGLKWFEGLHLGIDSLESLPSRCPLATENRSFASEVRQLFYGKRPHVYRIIFNVNDDVVTVLHIRHGRRSPLIQY